MPQVIVESSNNATSFKLLRPISWGQDRADSPTSRSNYRVAARVSSLTSAQSSNAEQISELDHLGFPSAHGGATVIGECHD